MVFIYPMEKQYTFEELESFAKSMKRMSDFIRSQKPNFIFAPVIGSVPLIDALGIVDRHFSFENVEYPPNSSRFTNREELIRKWYSNFLDTNYSGSKMSVICVDEVISGSSASKGQQEFQKMLHERGLEKKIKYTVVGIGEKPKGGKKRNHNFQKLVNSKKAKVFETQNIITADNILLNPVRLKVGELNPQGRNTYLPEIHSLDYSPEYRTLLHDIATFSGADPDHVSLQNILKVGNSLRKYLG